MKKDLSTIIKTLKEAQDIKHIELDKEYYVTEWSWNPICDGYIVYKEHIKYMEIINGVKVYTTGNNYRVYYSWDIFETKEQCKEMNDFKNSFGYDWCEQVDNLVTFEELKNNTIDCSLGYNDIDWKEVEKSLELRGKFKVEDLPKIIQQFNEIKESKNREE